MNYFKKSLAVSIIAVLLLAFAYTSFEPNITHATSTASDTVLVTLNVTEGISITSPADVSMSAALGVAQSSAVGSSTWNVKTNAANGYTLAVRATSTPALKSPTNAILDYQTGAPNTWVATTTQAYFGYSGYGTDISTGTWGTGSSCSGATQHATSTTLKYKGFTTSDVTIATRAATTTPSGVDAVICYAVEQGSAFYVPSGTYTATIIATATTL
jgi:hypothetical protein